MRARLPMYGNTGGRRYAYFFRFFEPDGREPRVCSHGCADACGDFRKRVDGCAECHCHLRRYGRDGNECSHRNGSRLQPCGRVGDGAPVPRSHSLHLQYGGVRYGCPRCGHRIVRGAVFNRNLGGRGMALRHPNERKPRTHCWNNGSGRSAYGGFFRCGWCAMAKGGMGAFHLRSDGLRVGRSGTVADKAASAPSAAGLFSAGTAGCRGGRRVFAWRAGWAKVHWRFAAGPRLCHGANPV